jgi:uncharacterized protein
MPLDREFRITDAKGGAAFTVRVVTRAAKTEFAGNEDGTLKVRLVASGAGSPEANRELTDFLATLLNVSPNQVEVVAGEGGREKIISVMGITTGDVETILGGNP